MALSQSDDIYAQADQLFSQQRAAAPISPAPASPEPASVLSFTPAAAPAPAPGAAEAPAIDFGPRKLTVPTQGWFVDQPNPNPMHDLPPEDPFKARSGKERMAADAQTAALDPGEKRLRKLAAMAGGASTQKRPPDFGRGNIDLNHRPVVHNPDGSISTVNSIGVGEGDKANPTEILIPTVRAGLDRIMTAKEAIDWYKKTGEHLGKFTGPNAIEESTTYAKSLHESQAKLYGGSDTPDMAQFEAGLPHKDFSSAPGATEPNATEVATAAAQEVKAVGYEAMALPSEAGKKLGGWFQERRRERQAAKDPDYPEFAKEMETFYVKMPGARTKGQQALATKPLAPDQPEAEPAATGAIKRAQDQRAIAERGSRDLTEGQKAIVGAAGGIEDMAIKGWVYAAASEALAPIFAPLSEAAATIEKPALRWAAESFLKVAHESAGGALAGGALNPTNTAEGAKQGAAMMATFGGASLVSKPLAALLKTPLAKRAVAALVDGLTMASQSLLQDKGKGLTSEQLGYHAAAQAFLGFMLKSMTGGEEAKPPERAEGPGVNEALSAPGPEGASSAVAASGHGNSTQGAGKPLQSDSGPGTAPPGPAGTSLFGDSAAEIAAAGRKGVPDPAPAQPEAPAPPPAEEAQPEAKPAVDLASEADQPAPAPAKPREPEYNFDWNDEGLRKTSAVYMLEDELGHRPTKKEVRAEWPSLASNQEAGTLLRGAYDEDGTRLYPEIMKPKAKPAEANAAPPAEETPPEAKPAVDLASEAAARVETHLKATKGQEAAAPLAADETLTPEHLDAASKAYKAQYTALGPAMQEAMKNGGRAAAAPINEMRGKALADMRAVETAKGLRGLPTDPDASITSGDIEKSRPAYEAAKANGKKSAESAEAPPSPDKPLPGKEAPQTSEPTTADNGKSPGEEAPKPPEPPKKAAPAPEPGPEGIAGRTAGMKDYRKKMGISVLPSEDRRTKEEALERAIAQGIPDRAREIAERVLEKPRPLSAEEEMGMLDKLVTLRHDHQQLLDEQARLIEDGADKNKIDIEDNLARQHAIERDMDVITHAKIRGGTAWSQAGHARQAVEMPDHTLASRITEFTINKGRAPDKAERANLVKQQETIDALTKERDALLQQVRERDVKDQIAQERRAPRRRTDREAIEAEYGDSLEKVKALLRAGCGVS